MNQREKTPASTSGDHDAMASYWQMVSTILGGPAAMRAAGEAYLPRFPHETEADYKLRLHSAKFTNVFADIVETLASKPFEEEVSVEGTTPAIDELIEDIDGQGNHLHVFAAQAFYQGVADALTWIMVDYTRGVPDGATRAQEAEIGARPYWVHIPAASMLAVYSAQIGGVETFTHVRYREDVVVRNGWGESTLERVRVIDREVVRDEFGEAVSAGTPVWSLYEKQKVVGAAKEEWVEIASGTLSIGVIPLVPFVSGRRRGTSWRVRPPLEDAADLQIKLYRYESGLDHAADMTCFPMLAGNGVDPPPDIDGKGAGVPVGPKAVLFAPPGQDGKHGEWKFIEPGAQSLTFIAERMVKVTEQQIRELGRQPLTAQSGNITTITAAFAGDKAHTVIEAWTLNFKDALEKALALSAQWRGEAVEPEVSINTDFALALREDNGVSSIESARQRGDMSQETYWQELKRRGVLSPNFDADRERERILEELPGDPSAVDEEAAFGVPDPVDG
jgi:hypothetical protein